MLMTGILGRIREYVRIIRINQWYKNLVVFLPIFFAEEFLNTNALFMTALGFLSLGLVSSANYVMNDLIDVDRDRAHPEKRFRPLASRKMSFHEAMILFIISLVLGLGLAYSLNYLFLIFASALFMLSLAYSLWLKNEPVLDIIIISVNFVIRAISGAFIMNILISPWLILCPLFVAIVLALGKRESDMSVLKQDASKHKLVLGIYTPRLIDALMIISTTCLIITYALYALSKKGWLLITVPLAIYAIFRYYYLVDSGSEIARNPGRFYKDKRLLISLIIWTLLLFLIIYFINYDTSNVFLK